MTNNPKQNTNTKKCKHTQRKQYLTTTQKIQHNKMKTNLQHKHSQYKHSNIQNKSQSTKDKTKETQTTHAIRKNTNIEQLTNLQTTANTNTRVRNIHGKSNIQNTKRTYKTNKTNHKDILQEQQNNYKLATKLHI